MDMTQVVQENGLTRISRLAEVEAEATIEGLNGTLSAKRIDAMRIVSIILEPARFDPAGRLVKPFYRILYRP
jgi:hypothetical protein